MKKLLTLFTLLLTVCSGAWAQTLVEADNMETTSGSGSSLTVSGFSKGDCTISQSTEARTGSYSLKTEYNGTNDKTVKTTNSSISVAKNDNLHVIAWAKMESGDETAEGNTNQAGSNSYIGGNGKGTYVDLSASTWKQVTSAKKASSNVSNAYVLLQRKHSAKKAVLFDDVVIYTSTNETTDIVAPTAATSASATASAISWTVGTDANTGVQKTLIFKRTSGSADDLTLNNQGVYSLVASEGPSTDQSGHWTLVAVVNGDATSYEAALDGSTRYAIVHRDLAYNYSTPTYVTTPSAGAYTIEKGEHNNGNFTISPSSADEGDVITLSANPNDGFAFNSWRIFKTGDTNTKVEPTSGDANTTFTMPAYDVTVDARFVAIPFNITHAAAEHGTYTIRVASEEPVSENTVGYIGQTVYLVATPDVGYALKAWNVTETLSGNAVTMISDNAFDMPTVDVTIAPEFDAVYTVTFNLQGHGSAIEAQEVLNGGKVTEPTAPTADGWVFGGWYKEAGCENAWNFDTDVVTETKTLFAKWTENVAPTAGIIYSLTFVNSSKKTMSDGDNLDLTPTYATITGGSAMISYFKSGNTNKEVLTSDNEITYGTNDMYLKLTLNDPLQEGDEISLANGSGTYQICIATTAGTPKDQSSKVTTENFKYTVQAGDVLEGKKILYLGRSDASSVKHKAVTITRNNSITLNNVDGAANGFSTFCSPNNFTVSGATAYKASIADNKLTLTEVTGIIPANAGVVLAGTTGATATIAYTNSTATADMDGNDLKGTTARVLTSTLKGEYAHFLAFQKTTNTFKEYNGTNFPANKAYVVTNDTEGREFEMIFGEQENDEQGTETDGIAGVEAEKNANVAYNLAGQKVGKDYKGIVIVNGKKVIRK